MARGLAAYLELHIEQGPVLEREETRRGRRDRHRRRERLRLRFEGQAPTPAPRRWTCAATPVLAAAATALAVEDVARRHGGVWHLRHASAASPA